MADYKPSNYLIGIILFVLIILCTVSMFSIATQHDRSHLTADDYGEFEAAFNKSQEIEDQVDSLHVGVSESNPDPGLFGVLNSLISTSWNTLKLLGNSLSFMDDVWQGLNDLFGVPLFVPTLIGAIILIIIVFAIWGAIFQSDL